MDAVERFTAAARTFLDNCAGGSSHEAEAVRVFSDFLRERFADFQMPWGAFGVGAGAARGAPPPSVGDLPAFGASREQQQRWQRLASAAQRIDDAQRRLQRLWSDMLRDAAAAFAARLMSPPPGPVSSEALQALYAGWIDCAEDAYARMAHGEAFCNALAEFVNASSQWRLELQASTGHMAKLLDLPTRSEINTLLQRLKSIEDRLHAAPEPTAPTRPSRKRSARSKTKP